MASHLADVVRLSFVSALLLVIPVGLLAILYLQRSRSRAPAGIVAWAGALVVGLLGALIVKDSIDAVALLVVVVPLCAVSGAVVIQACARAIRGEMIGWIVIGVAVGYVLLLLVMLPAVE